jgi:hypothetical protein
MVKFWGRLVQELSMKELTQKKERENEKDGNKFHEGGIVRNKTPLKRRGSVL